jgi:hypothetical protein
MQQHWIGGVLWDKVPIGSEYEPNGSGMQWLERKALHRKRAGTLETDADTMRHLMRQTRAALEGCASDRFRIILEVKSSSTSGKSG